MERFQIPGAPTCRIAYVTGVFKKTAIKSVESSKEKYNCWILIPKDDDEKVTKLLAMYDEAFQELRVKGFKGKTAEAIDRKQNCLVDGDKLADLDDSKEPFRGYYIVKTSSNEVRPIVTDMQGRRILNGVPLQRDLAPEDISADDLGSGDYVFACINFWTYFQPSFQGIGANLYAVKRYKEGDAIGGGSDNVNDYLDTSGYE